MTTQFGKPTEQAQFFNRHSHFFEKWPNLEMAINAALDGKRTCSTKTDKVVFATGNQCIEDFREILLLCGNGYGLGAMKVLRSLYERAVTARHLHLHSEQTDDFIDFFWVNAAKLNKRIQEAYGDSFFDAFPDQKEKFKEIEEQRAAVKERFQVTICKKCEKKGGNYTWSKEDFVTLASKVGELGKPLYILVAYYLPTEQAHSTMQALLSRLGQTQEAGVTFDHEPKRREADLVFHVALFILLDVLRLQYEHFNIEALRIPLDQWERDFDEIAAKELPAYLTFKRKGKGAEQPEDPTR